MRFTSQEIHTLQRELLRRGVEVRPKTSSRLMRLIGWLLAFTHINKRFATHYTTMVWQHIYYPSTWGGFSLDCDEDIDRHFVTLRHELVHMGQRERWGVLWAIAYVMLPIPFFFAWWRWKFERDAYCVNLRYGATPEQLTNALHSYGRPWPRRLILKWFEKQHDSL